MKQRTPSAERLYQARKQASRELKLPITSWQVRRYALLAVAHDNVTARLASGADINVDNLLKLDAAMQEIKLSVPQEPTKVTVDIVEGISLCPKCGYKAETASLPPPPDPPPNPPPSTPPSDDTTKPEPLPAAALPALPTNVVPLRQRMGRSDSAFHDQPGVPLKKYQAGNPGASYGNSNPFAPTGPAPDWSAAHALPSPNWDVLPR